MTENLDTEKLKETLDVLKDKLQREKQAYWEALDDHTIDHPELNRLRTQLENTWDQWAKIRRASET